MPHRLVILSILFVAAIGGQNALQAQKPTTGSSDQPRQFRETSCSPYLAMEGPRARTVPKSSSASFQTISLPEYCLRLWRLSAA